jgi:hypothetical protein
MPTPKTSKPSRAPNPAPPVTTPHTTKSAEKISFLKVLLLFSLTFTGILSGGLCYYSIRRYQTLFDDQHFHGVVHDHFKSTKKSFSLQLKANVAIATALSFACSSISKWPNCKVSSPDVSSHTAPLADISGVKLFSVAPIVRPENRKAFEAFAVKYYATDGGYPKGSGVSGIFRYENGERVKSPNHTDPTTHRHDILVPLLYSSAPSQSDFLINTYDDSTLRPTLDEVYDCVTNASYTATVPPQSSCSTISPFIPTEVSSAIATPIRPYYNPDTVVGFVAAVFSWETLFSTAVQHDFDFQCSIQSDSSPVAQTFTIKNGVAHATTGITHFPPSFDGFWRQPKQSFILNPEDILVKETKYTVTYYSSTTSPSPLLAVAASVSCVGITCLISLIFVFFNTLIARAALEASMLLDSKRTYVRFVSHEIRCTIPFSPSSPPLLRTPLNTISLSIRILSESLTALREELHVSGTLMAKEGQVTADSTRLTLLLEECLSLVDDLDENSSVAVMTLNDLINYDKIETNTFAIEEKDVDIWTVIEKTVGPLVHQAKEKNIDLNFATRLTDEDVALDLDCLRVVGDSMKLAQVVRNLVSNALKFTPARGEVKIAGIPHLPLPSLPLLALFSPLGSLFPTDSYPRHLPSPWGSVL